MEMILNELITILKENAIEADYDSISMETDILGELNIDSISVLSIIPAIESRYEIDLDPLVLLEKRTVGEVIDVIGSLSAQVQASSNQ